eukprot:SAG31_NODE_17891_length_654_cov_1.282883_1_plen_134_part_01
MCYAHLSPAWFPYPAQYATSGRMRWPCRGASDCSLNGACGADGGCACDAAWRGLRCSELNLLAVNRSAPGYQPSDHGRPTAVWGGGMAAGPDAEGRPQFHLWSTEYTKHCGDQSWWTNAEITHAVSSSPFGPYR